jgi:hypothetical protein
MAQPEPHQVGQRRPVVDGSRPFQVVRCAAYYASIRQSYTKTPFFKDYIGLFEDAYSREWEYLIDLDIFFINELTRCLSMGDKQIVRASGLHIGGDRVERLVNLCRFFGADVFYEGLSGKNYIEEGLFRDQGIRVEYQSYEHPVYQQCYGEFIPYLSVVDLLFNHGKESLSIITGVGKGVAET